MSEAALHKTVAEYLALVLPSTVYWSTISHGGFPLHPRIAKRLKDAGLRPGVPDIMLVHEGMARFIELKSYKGVTSPAQKQAHKDIERAGGCVAICRNLPEVDGVLRGWGIKRVAA